MKFYPYKIKRGVGVKLFLCWRGCTTNFGVVLTLELGALAILKGDTSDTYKRF